MKYYYYIPFGFTYCVCKILELFLGEPDPKARWHKYFSTGFTQENFSRFMDDMEKVDPSIYWLMIVSPNGLVCALTLLIILI